jgi:hypothetical protein
MKTTIALLLAMLAPCWLSAQEDADPFAPLKPGEVVPPGADIDPFVQAGDASEADDTHRWDDHVVKPGDSKSPAYVTTSGMYNPSLQTFDIQFEVDLKKYRDAVAHPDLNRGVILMSGQPEQADLYTWLRPFSIHGDKAMFVVVGTSKQLEEMLLAFIPREGKEPRQN